VGNPLVFTKEFSDNIDLALAMKEDDRSDQPT